MARRMAHLTITLAQVGDIERGLWCRDCALPSGLGVNIEGRSESGHRYLSTFVAVCGDCGGKNVDSA